MATSNCENHRPYHIIDGWFKCYNCRQWSHPIPRVQKRYVYTLDAHECFGPFLTEIAAREWAHFKALPSYQILSHPPFSNQPIQEPQPQGE